MLTLDLVDDQTLVVAERPLLEVAVDAQRLADRLGDDRSGLERADQRARHDEIDRAGRDDPRRRVGLRQPFRVERDVAVPLEAALDVPVGLPVAQERECARRDRHVCTPWYGSHWNHCYYPS